MDWAASSPMQTTASLPQDLLLALSQCLLAWSAVLCTKCDAAGDDSVQMPKELLECAIAWVQCVMSTTATLNAQDDAQLAWYLQVCGY